MKDAAAMCEPLPARYKPYPTYQNSSLEWLEQVPAHWSGKPLKRVFRVFNGSTPSTEVPEYWDGDIPWVTPEDLGNLAGVRIDFSRRALTQAGYLASGATLVPVGSLVLSTRAPIGHVAIAGVRLCTNQGCRSLVFRSDSCRRFFYYQILTLRSELESLGQGSTFTELAKAKLENVFVLQPSLAEQHQIASWLDSETARIDAGIASNDQLIELLQEKRSALISRAVTKGLDSSVAMKASGFEDVGDIPAHWDVKPLTKYVLEKSDYRGQTPQKVTSGVFLVTAKNVKMGWIDYECSQEFVAEDEYREIMRRGLPRRGDILFTTEAPLGNVALVEREDIALAQRIIRFRVDQRFLLNEFVLLAMTSDYFQAQLSRLSTGSTAEGLKASKLPMLRIVAPPPDEQRRVSARLGIETRKIDTLIARVRLAIDRLTELRTALISAAVTGKIDVRDETVELPTC